MAQNFLLHKLQENFGQYVEGLTKENLKMQVFAGTITQKNLKLKKEALAGLNLPVQACSPRSSRRVWTAPPRHAFRPDCSLFPGTDAQRVATCLAARRDLLTPRALTPAAIFVCCAAVLSQVRAGYVGEFHVEVPWRALESKPVKVRLDRVYLFRTSMTTCDSCLVEDGPHFVPA